MDETRLRELLNGVSTGATPVDEALGRLRDLPFEDLGFAKVDHHRALRQGFPEAVFAAGKTPEQIVAIVSRQRERGSNVLVTRCAPEAAEAVLAAHPDAVHHEAARTVTIAVAPPPPLTGYIAVVSAGTSDIPVAEEAALTCETGGSSVERIHDVGVAGLHRILSARERLADATVIIVCAGMEGALPSVVGGLVSQPVIAVPTSVGYGASFGGLAALLGMLNTCAAGVSVVNIDNGFGAGIMAGMIHRLAVKGAPPSRET